MLNDILDILAYAAITISAIGFFVIPYKISQKAERLPFGYSDFVQHMIEAAILVPLALRVLGVI